MANYNAKGRPKLGRVRKQMTLPPALIDRVNSLCQQQDWNFSYAIERLLYYALESPPDAEGDSNSQKLAAALRNAPPTKNSRNHPPAKPHG